MPNFTAPVGDMAKNEVHDVALLQGALLILKTHKRLNFWEGPVDGDWRGHQQSLTEALKKLEAAAKITNGPGRIEPGGPLTRALKQLLPPQYQSLAAIPGTACLTIQDPYGSQHKGPALKDLALHDQCRRELEQLMKAGADKLGLELVIDKEETDHKDARLNPLAPGAPTPRPIKEQVAKQVQPIPSFKFKPGAQALEVELLDPVDTVPGGNSTITTKRGVFHEFGQRAPHRRNIEEAFVRSAVREVDRLLQYGPLLGKRAPKPAENYVIRGKVIYDSRIMKSADGISTLYGLNEPVSAAKNESRIYIFSPAARSEDDAVHTYAHELWHFNVERGDDETLADAYGRAILKVLRGGIYDGPQP